MIVNGTFLPSDLIKFNNVRVLSRIDPNEYYIMRYVVFSSMSNDDD